MTKKDKKKATEKEGLHRLITLIIDQMKAGHEKEEIVNKLVEIGIDEEEADCLVDTVAEEILDTPSKKK